jgi:hypothetical protein
MAWVLVVFVALIAFMVDLWAGVLSRFREGGR